MKTREELIEKVIELTDKYSDNQEVINYMQNIYDEKNMEIRTVNAVFKGAAPINTLDDIDRAIFITYLNEAIKEEDKYELEDYLTDLEVQKIKEFYNADSKNQKVDRMVFKNVTKVKNQYLIPFVSYYDIFSYWNNRLLTYNFETQRDPKLSKTVNNSIVKQANINWNSVNDISKEIFADDFTANLITFNVRKTSKFTQQGVIYDEIERTLTIIPSFEKGKEVYVDIIDGFHRTLSTLAAVSKANEEGKKLEYGFMLSITNFTVREAQNYIRREDKRNPIDKEYSKSLEKDEYYMFVDVLKEAGDSSNNKMKNMVGNTLDEVMLFKKYTSSNILHDGFRLSGLDFSDAYMNDVYLDHFIGVFNTILGYYQFKYKNDIEKLEKETIVMMPNAFVGYIAIGAKLLNVDNSKQVLRNLLEENKINLDKNAHDWESIDILKKNPRSYKKIYDYFKKLV